MEVSKFPEILGELSMREQCVPDSFFSAHAREPGSEATCHHEHSVACGVHCIRYVNLHKAALVSYHRYA